MHANRFGGVLALVACLALVAGCAQKSSDEHHGSGQATAEKETPPAVAEAGQAAATGEVQLAGTLGCGHCAYQVTSECAAVVKTAAGEVYVIDGVPETSELWAKRLEANQQIALTGTVLGAADDKLKHFAMTSFELR